MAVFFFLNISHCFLNAQQNRNIPSDTSPRWAIFPPQIDENLLKNVIEDQMEALRAGDISRAYYIYTSSEFKTSSSLEDFSSFVNRYAVIAKNKTVDVTSTSRKENAVIFRGTLTSTDGQKLDVEYDLVKENDEWKIQGMQLFSHQ